MCRANSRNALAWPPAGRLPTKITSRESWGPGAKARVLMPLAPSHLARSGSSPQSTTSLCTGGISAGSAT